MGYAPEVVDGVLTSEQPLNDEGQPAWYQYFIADQIPTQVGKSYVATVKIKTSTDASMALNMGWGWGDGEILNSTINTTTEWAEIPIHSRTSAAPPLTSCSSRVCMTAQLRSHG